MGSSWSRRHPTTIALVAAAFAALLLLSQARLVTTGSPVAPAGVVVVHTATGHGPVWVGLRAARARGGHPRGGHTSAVMSGTGLAVVLLTLIGAARRRRAFSARGFRAPVARGPPRVAG